MLSLTHRYSTPIYQFQAFGLSLTYRCFSLSHRRRETSPLSDTKPVKDAKPHKKSNDARNFRYANDPEYRAKILAQNRDRHKYLFANDPEYRAKNCIRTTAWLKARIASDPEYHAKYNARNLAYVNARYRSDAQYREHHLAERAAVWAKLDPVTREGLLQRQKVYNKQKYANDYTFKQRHRLQMWLRRNIPVRALAWRTHDAELHADRVARLCSGEACGFEKKLKLWMKRKHSDPALYDCYNCFASDWVPEKVFPIGYEHVIFGSGETVEPGPVPLDAAANKASRDANPSSGAGTTS